MDVSITKQALKRLEEQSKLSSNAVTRFRRKIYQIVSGQVCAGQIAKMHGHQCIFRIRFNISLRIIATVVKTDSRTQFRILDFVTHDQMDRDQYVTNTIEFQDFCIDSELNDDLEITNSINSICSNEKLQIDESDFEAQRDDFYLHIPDPKRNQNPDLWLSSEQKQFLEKEMPVLLTGSAGSGKTTILIYHALSKSFENIGNRVLYVTYNKFLQKEAERIAKEVFPNYPQNLKFCHYLELCTDYVEGSQFNEIAEINQQRFIKEFYKTHSNIFRGVDPVSVWQEIRNLIKGSASSSENDNVLLSIDEYAQSKNDSSLSNWAIHRDVYNIAKIYQGWLTSQNYWDEIDITHKALKQIGNSADGKYTAIYCDEIQDLTKNQISLLLKLLGHDYVNIPEFFLTGDPAQIINPSGFSWNKVKTLIHSFYNDLPRYRPVKHDELKLNFRSAESIVNLGSKILKFNNGYTELLSQEAHRKGGDMPLVVNIAESNILRDNDDFGSRNAIIVANEQEKSKLKKQFSKDGIESERIFLFTEVKGLEFDEVLVWKFFEHFENWTSDAREFNKFKYNLLYVCTTRAREKIYFYDGKNINSFWEHSEIRNHVSISKSPEVLISFFNADETDEQKIQTAEKYEKLGKYELAKEIYIRLGRLDLVTRIDALIYEEARDFANAGRIWSSLGQWENAGNAYEKVKLWEDAERCWDKLDKYQRQAFCLEQLGRFEDVAFLYEIREDWNEAEKHWRKLSNWEKVALACEKQEKWSEAALEWKKVPNFEKAADNYCRIDSYKEAVRCLLEVENWQRIEEIYRNSSTLSKFADLCENRENWTTLEKVLTEIYTQKGWKWVSANDGKRLASVQEKNGNLDNAINTWLDYAKNPEKAVELLLKQKKWQRALQLTEEINDSKLRQRYKDIANSGLQEENQKLGKLVKSYQQDEYEQIENHEDYMDDEIEEYKRNYLMNKQDSDETEYDDIKSNYQDSDDDDSDDDLEWEDNNYYYEPPSAFDHIDYGYIMDMSSDYESGLWR
ncbi:AAA family ATPase [Pseudanabaena sp. FACHB-1998]|uniref:UvrD-helicase domain-containing protein n=1 Tax=Pseudanabaena sp. FACHB-1998 TaxID=2692858 RepID=UPI00167FFC7C|nr:UvrD-helicase domain-containing protein [Pseudanabaena sp. FACHB-1998]MBD2179472.1 AAA family ATPase [Pseudanabaena sp. FACHB-1998]